MSCSVTNIDSTTSKLSSGAPRRRILAQHQVFKRRRGRGRRSPALTPAVYASSSARSSGLISERARCASARNRWMRISRSSGEGARADERRTAPRRPGAARGPSGRSGPARAGSRWRAPRPRASRRGWSECPGRLASPAPAPRARTAAACPRAAPGCPRSCPRAHRAPKPAATSSRTKVTRKTRSSRRGI